MKRQLNQSLIKWKNQPGRMPLLLRGARQVGKSFLVEDFGKTHFKYIININFELKPEYKSCFKTLDPAEIIKSLSLLTQTPIIPSETLLFFDEAQECPRCIESLRYFKEQKPELHVIAAGSLLEFVLNDENFHMPVGRIQSLYLKPLSFYEFLDAIGKASWCEYLQTVTLSDGVDEVMHNQLLRAVREYLILGGMPAVVQQFIESNNFQFCHELQAAILETYRNDFGKYAKSVNHKYLQTVFEKTPGLAGQVIKYTNISQDIQSRDLKKAIKLLTYAGVLQPVYLSQANGLPLNTTLNENRFKLLFLDTGLVQYTTHLGIDTLLSDDILLLNRGSLAEQFVGQELLSYKVPYERAELFYWEREKTSSKAEVDYITHVGSTIIPVEVKAGKTGRLKSLQQFLEEKKLNLGVRISQHPLAFERKILSLPLYMIAEFDRLVKTIES